MAFQVVIDDKKLGNDYEDFSNSDDLEDIVPDHYYGGGKIPVFKPSMKQFESFKKFVDKINHYGMKSGIVKIIAPQEWIDSLPPLDEKVKSIKIKNPIEQHIAGTGGIFRQTNLEKQRTYTLPQWRQLCESVDHQPPAKRGERRAGQAPKFHKLTGRKSNRTKKSREGTDEEITKDKTPPSPGSPNKDEKILVTENDHRGTPAPKTDSHGRQPRARRNARKMDADEEFDDADFEGFDYRLHSRDEFTPERCEELEKNYWRMITYNSPLYGADQPGSLFDGSTTSWNVAKLENLLDCLGAKLPGVNTAYLYLGMWKSTFAWHLEDCDLYSINYIHFGAPKQWYSICQEDAPKFEAVLKSIWPNEAKKCSQFLRHKTFLVSPALLEQRGIKVNKLVHYQGEFVITFPYGYHSGYNLGYNCAESVNFATESWLEYGRITKRCECVHDSVWVDVEEIERRLRGEQTDAENYGDGNGENMEGSEKALDILTPPESVDMKPARAEKRKRKSKKETGDTGARAVKKVRRVNLRVNLNPVEHCILCPNYIPTEEMLVTDNGKKAHRLCALYTPETYFACDPATGKDFIYNVAGIPKARIDLKCAFCKIASKGACFQCSTKKCTKAFHATCALAAGVLVDWKEHWVQDEDGKWRRQSEIHFQCKVHRPKRHPDFTSETLEEHALTMDYGRILNKGDVVQMQYYKGNIFAGVVVENRISEESVVVNVLPKGDKVEVEWKWILVSDPLPHLSQPPEGAALHNTPNPANRPTNTRVKGKDNREIRAPNEEPQTGDYFGDSKFGRKWEEFEIAPIEKNPDQMPVNFSKNFWYYLGEKSTEYIPKYSEDPSKRVPNDAALPDKPQQTRAKRVPKSTISYPAASHPATYGNRVGASQLTPWNGQPCLSQSWLQPQNSKEQPLTVAHGQTPHPASTAQQGTYLQQIHFHQHHPSALPATWKTAGQPSQQRLASVPPQQASQIPQHSQVVPPHPFCSHLIPKPQPTQAQTEVEQPQSRQTPVQHSEPAAEHRPQKPAPLSSVSAATSSNAGSIPVLPESVVRKPSPPATQTQQNQTSPPPSLPPSLPPPSCPAPESPISTSPLPPATDAR